MDETHPHSRQLRLSEVGVSGQALIDAASLSLPANGEGALVELAYLARAGVGRVTLTRAPCPSFRHAAAFRHEPARRLAAGSWRALEQLRKTLGMPAT